MTAPQFDLRRSTRHPAVGLFRVTAVSAALTLPLVWLLTAWAPFGPKRCGHELGSDGVPLPCLDVIRVDDAVFRALLATGCVELLALAIYLAVALPRTTAPAIDILRRLPACIGVVALAVGAFAGAVDGTGAGLLIPLFLLWLLAPLIVLSVERADPRSAVLILLGLLPSGVVSGILVLDDLYNGLAAVMFVASAVLVIVRRLR